MTPKVSIIISNRNDIAMLAVTVRSCIEELKPLGAGAGEIIIVDNSDEGIYNALSSALPVGYCRDKTLKIYHQNFPCLFTARETAAEKASGEYIMCLDSHMLVGHDCILDLTNFMERHKNDGSLAFAHAPISWAHQHEQSAKHDRDMSTNELGDWNKAYPNERLITWKGMPWMCRRDWFLDRDRGLNAYGALAEHRISWGGGDMHIGIKPWLLGFKNWAVPTSPCIHIGPFPKVEGATNNHKYRLYSSSGSYPHTFGFLVSCYILGGDAMIQRNMDTLKSRFGKYIVANNWVGKAKELGESEKSWLDKRKKLTFEQLLTSKPWDS